MNERQEFIVLMIMLIVGMLVASAWDIEMEDHYYIYPAPQATSTPVAYPKPVVPTATKKPKLEKYQPKPTAELVKPTNAPTESYP